MAQNDTSPAHAGGTEPTFPFHPVTPISGFPEPEPKIETKCVGCRLDFNTPARHPEAYCAGCQGAIKDALKLRRAALQTRGIYIGI
jgi:hypothetical protein